MKLSPEEMAHVAQRIALGNVPGCRRETDGPPGAEIATSCAELVRRRARMVNAKRG